MTDATGGRCHNCDRTDCPFNGNGDWMGGRIKYGVTKQGAAADCAAHAIAWRARCLAAEAEVSRLSPQAVGGEPAPGVLTGEQLEALRVESERTVLVWGSGPERDAATWTLALLSDHAKMTREIVAMDGKLEAVTGKWDAAKLVLKLLSGSNGCDGRYGFDGTYVPCYAHGAGKLCIGCRAELVLELNAARSTPGGGR